MALSDGPPNHNPADKPGIANFAAFSAMIMLVSSIIRIGACLYLPAIPIIGETLNISNADMGFTITIYFAVFSIFSLVSGPCSDAFGRRLLIIIGIIVFIIGSIVCGIANAFPTLLTGRIIQAVGASMIPGTSRAMVRDAGNDVQVVSLLGWLGVLGGVFLVGAPILGGVITEHFGWRSNFWFLLGFGMVILTITILRLQETLAPEKRFSLAITPVFKSYTEMLTSAEFILSLLPIIFCFIFQGAYLAAAPFIFIRDFQLSPTQFGLSNIVIVLAITAGRYISVAAIKHYSDLIGYRIGGGIIFLAGIVFAAIFFFQIDGLTPLFMALALFCIGFGTLSPIGMKSSITVFREKSGMAAAMQGCLMLGSVAIGSAMISTLMKHFPNLLTVYIFSALVIGVALLTFISALAGSKRLV
jgi:DHA1 family bicyclomycin/chloramphenicol resistance-like MFS transporter